MSFKKDSIEIEKLYTEGWTRNWDKYDNSDDSDDSDDMPDRSGGHNGSTDGGQYDDEDTPDSRHGGSKNIPPEVLSLAKEFHLIGNTIKPLKEEQNSLYKKIMELENAQNNLVNKISDITGEPFGWALQIARDNNTN